MSHKIMTAFVVGNDKVELLIKQVRRAGKNYDKLVHKAALSICYHAHDTGDYRKAQSLMDAMPNGTRNTSMRDWLVKFLPITYQQDTDTFVYAKDKRITDNKALLDHMEEADNKPYWKMKGEEKEGAKFALGNSLAALLKKATKAYKNKEVTEQEFMHLCIMTSQFGVEVPVSMEEINAFKLAQEAEQAMMLQ